MKIVLPFRSSVPFLGALTALTLVTGCGDSKPAASAEGHGHAHDDHAHAPPHGGTPVLLGKSLQLELVADSIEGKMLAYVYDAEFHEPVRVTETNFLLQARFDGRSETLSFNRSPNPATGAVPEKSALFDARADWLKTVKIFEGTLPAPTLGGQSFTNVTFSFPKGTAHSH
jgi:hypothetical protein